MKKICTFITVFENKFMIKIIIETKLIFSYYWTGSTCTARLTVNSACTGDYMCISNIGLSCIYTSGSTTTRQCLCEEGVAYWVAALGKCGIKKLLLSQGQNLEHYILRIFKTTIFSY